MRLMLAGTDGRGAVAGAVVGTDALEPPPQPTAAAAMVSAATNAVRLRLDVVAGMNDNSYAMAAGAGMTTGRAAALACAVAVLAVVAPAVAAARTLPRASPFQWRGIVDGPYGQPWDHGRRDRVLRWMGVHGLNGYVHAPKNDLYQRTNWRDPYPVAEQAEFVAEIALARRLGVDWIPNLSPALPEIPTPAVPDRAPSRDLCFACPADLDAVLAKLERFRAAGARTFMISFDDIAKVLTHPEDLAAYGAGDEGFGRANGDFLTRLAAALRARTPRAQLLTVGADYSGTGDTGYLRGLRAKLAPGIEVMWTGPGIPSQDFSAADAHAYGETIGRRPLVWDNWTDDDTAGNALPVGTARIFLGPYRRRAEVAGAVGGFFLNPMNEADLNMLPLATAADFLRDPTHYDARSAWLRAVADLAPGRGVRARRLRATLRAWAETSYSTKLDPTEAPSFVRRADVFLRAYAADPRWSGQAAGLDGELALAERAQARLPALPNRAFAAEAAPFLDSAHTAAGAGRAGVALLESERPAIGLDVVAGGWRGRVRAPDPARASARRDEFGQAALRTRTSVRFTYGWRGGVAFDIPPSPAPPNVMDTFLDRVSALDQAWQSQAGLAASSVAVTLDGAPVALASDGSFSLGRAACGRLLVATDGAGGRNGLRIDCRAL